MFIETNAPLHPRQRLKKHQRIFVLPAIITKHEVKITARKFTLYLGAGLYIKYKLDVSSYCSRKS